jgi:peptidoglycan-associated lipoprotein
MKRLSIVSIIVLAALMLFAGCAKKPISDATATGVLPGAETSGETLASANVAEQQASDETSSAAITSLDGIKLEAVYFDYDSTILSAEARKALEQNAAWLKANPDVNVTIEGHCDERGSDEYNFALGENRALAVKNYLSGLGVTADRLATISYGEEHPATDGHNETAWAKNRRSEFN